MNLKSSCSLLAICLVCSTAWLAHAQGIQADRVSVQLSNPARPASIKASLKNGGITVKGYDGKEVVVEAQFRGRQPLPGDRTSSKSELSKVSGSPTGLKVQEENNVVTISVGPSDSPIHLTIQVPVKTSLNLGSVTNGAIFVQNVEGEIEASNQGGPVTVTNVAGVVIADSRNGKLLAQLNKVTPNKPMSFSTVNADIDVTLPPDIKAKVKLATQNGRTQSDFDIGRGNGGDSITLNSGDKQLTLFHKVADINGGGPEISFKTVNGNIFIRKGSKQ